MYKRLTELKEIQAKTGLTTTMLARKIDISYITIKRVMNGLSIQPSTSNSIDCFLDSPMEDFFIEKLIEYKNTSGLSYPVIAKKIGISGKTIYNALNFPAKTSESTKKLITNFIENVCKV